MTTTAEGPAPATPDSYGQSPFGYRAPAGTRLGRVKLLVSDLRRSVAYYERVLGLRVVAGDATSAHLAPLADDTVLIELHTQPGLQAVPRQGRLGLYHFALLVPDRPSLGRLVAHLQHLGVRAGSSDHLVSEALYLTDPDNLGIEVYVDRPRESWRRVGRELMMATNPIDMPGLLRAAGEATWSGMPAGTVVGHVHLHVGDLGSASAFYSDVLGLDRTVWHYPGALFFSAGGYHHHLGANTWAGREASAPLANEARLLEWTLEVPGAASVSAVGKNLARGNHPVEAAPIEAASQAILTRDPWGTQLRIVSG